MNGTKENILIISLKLFAKYGYEAVSVSKIAGELGITKGALYKHYKNKRAIFNSIVNRMFKLDIERSTISGVPLTDFENNSNQFKETNIENMTNFIKEQFKFWLEDEFAFNFRKMLTLEQYKNSEMTDLYQKILVSGPLQYIEDLFKELIKKESWHNKNPKQMAIEFYSPFYLLLGVSDKTKNHQEKINILNLFNEQIDFFVEKHLEKKL